MEKDGPKESKPASKKSKDPRKTGDYYLTDDGALIRFLNIVERNQPPSLYQRLLNADVQNTGDLSKSQFSGIMTDLNMTPQDTMSLQRIAGFSKTQKSVLIDDFISAIKTRGKLRQEIEIETFKNIQKSIRKEGWTIQEAFDIFDIDNNEKIDYQEMVTGFQKLKVNVQNKHLKSVFAILDEDGNGTVSLEEFKNKLDFKSPLNENIKRVDMDEEIDSEEEEKEEYYQRMQDEKNEKEKADKDKEKLKQKEIDQYAQELRDGKIKPEKHKDPVQRKKNEEIKQKIDKEDKARLDSEMINGQLKVQMAKGIGLNYVKRQGFKYFFIELNLEGANSGKEFLSKPIDFFGKYNFEWSVMIPMIKCHPNDLGEEVHAKFHASKDSFENSSFVGEIYFKWKEAIKKPNEYVINSEFPMTDQNDDNSFGKLGGKVVINSKFIPAGVKDSNFTHDGKGKESLKEAKSKSDKPGHKGGVKKLGDLQVNVSKGRGFLPFMGHYLVFKLKGIQAKEQTKPVSDTAEPEFNETLSLPLYKHETQDVPMLIVEDVNADEDEVMSQFEYNISKLVNTTTHMVFNEKWYSFEDDESKQIKMKLTFVSESEKARNKSPKQKNINKKPRPAPTSNKPSDNVNFDINQVDGNESFNNKLPTPKIKEFTLDDGAIPDPKDTNKFADEFPSETESGNVSNYSIKDDNYSAKNKFEEDKSHLKKSPTPKNTEFRFDDSGVPDPKDTNKFSDENPTPKDFALSPKTQNLSSAHGSELDEELNDPVKAEQFNINDGGKDVSIASGDFEN